MNGYETITIGKSLWPSDSILHLRTRSALAQVIAWCLMAPSYYLNQYVDLSSVMFSENLLKAVAREITQPSISKNYLENYL